MLFLGCIPASGDPLPSLKAVTNGTEPGHIVDSFGREILLRGVNVNSHIEYWQHNPEFDTTYPFTEADADLLASMGWNLVRLAISWSRVEPNPGEYDDEYLDEIAVSISMLADRGVYTLIDLHQDAWGPSLVAPPATVCEEGRPAGGWDGAPAWATFDDGEPRCESGPRELVPAVRAAWVNFLLNREGPGGIGIRTRYVDMFAHLVKRFANQSSVAGYGIINEPNQFLPETRAPLSQLYEDALRAMRQAERDVGAPKRLFFFEPTIAWHAVGFPPPLPFEHGDQVVYSPHLYQEGIDPGKLEDAFARAAQETVELYKGAPVVTTEWGADPRRAKDPDDDYFERHLAEQDNSRFGAAMWTWHTSCGDAHAYPAARDGIIPFVWGIFNQNCEDNTYDGLRDEYVEILRRMAVRFAPGPLDRVEWAKDDTAIIAEGSGARTGNRLEVFVPTDDPASIRVDSTGLGPVQSTPWFGGTLFYAPAIGGAWSIQLRTGM
ncbi:MAG: cellulase family glycosylhydrolase [Leptospirales bacterium]